jgi:hypothetical protein
MWEGGWADGEISQIVDVAPNDIYTFSALAKGGIRSNGDQLGSIRIQDLQNDDNKVTMIPPTGEFKAHAGIGLMLGADVIVQKLAGPKIAIGPKLTADASLKVSQDVNDFKFATSVDVEFVGEIGAKLKIWKWELCDWEKEIKFGEGYNIFHYNFPHEEGDTENGSLDNLMKLLKPYDLRR